VPAADALVRVAERANARRSFLLVSSVLGKHLPVPAARCRLAGVALGLRVAGDARAERALEVLADADRDAGRAQALLDHLRREPPATPPGAVVIGFAETATALGEQVASSLDAEWFQTTTRQHAALAAALSFEEAHSHAPEQWIAVPAAGWPAGPLIIVDDELTTGATAARLIEALHARRPRARYVVAALVDGRPRGDGPIEACAATLGTSIEVVSLQPRGPQEALPGGWSDGALPAAPGGRLSPAPVRELRIGFGGPLQHHGQGRAARRALVAAARDAAVRIGPLPEGSLVLGTGEHLAFAQYCAQQAGALTSSSTRSPVLVSERPGYPIRDGLSFANPDAPDLAGFAYNVRARERPAIVVHFQDRAHRARGQQLLDALHQAGAPSLTAVTLAD
jgi:hypothetical protein